MTLNLSISAKVEASLREKAAAAGQDIATYASRVLERLAEPPLSVADLSGPLSQEFRNSGMSDCELGDFLEDVKHRSRTER